MEMDTFDEGKLIGGQIGLFSGDQEQIKDCKGDHQ